MRYNLGCALAVPAPNYTYRKIYCTHVSWQCEPSNEFFSVITERQTIPETHTHTHTHSQWNQLKRQKQNENQQKIKLEWNVIELSEHSFEKQNPIPKPIPIHVGPKYEYFVCVFLCSFLWPGIEFYFPCVFIIAQIRRTWKWGNGNENENVSAYSQCCLPGTFINYEWLVFLHRFAPLQTRNWGCLMTAKGDGQSGRCEPR